MPELWRPIAGYTGRAMNETTIKNAVLRFVKKEYPKAYCLKIADKFTSGIPDLLMSINGIFIGIELKVPGNKPTPIQEYQMAKIRESGGRTAVCHSAEEVKEFLGEVINNHV